MEILNFLGGIVWGPVRITSYNVCYTKLLRLLQDKLTLIIFNI